MPYISFSCKLVLQALSSKRLELSDLVGCSIIQDVGTRSRPWEIISVAHEEEGRINIKNGPRTLYSNIRNIQDWDIMVPHAKKELIEILKNLEDSIVQNKRSLIKKIVAERNIRWLYHFTRLDNVKNILMRGLVPRIPDPDFPIICTDPVRIDGRLDCVSLSISFPNDRMFYVKRKENPSSIWCVLVLNSSILYQYSCLFFPHNAARYNNNSDRDEWRGALALERQFQEDQRPKYLPACFPTDVQAEVQVESAIPLSLTKALYFEDENANKTFNSMKAKVPDGIRVEVNTAPFSNRDYAIEVYRSKRN